MFNFDANMDFWIKLELVHCVEEHLGLSVKVTKDKGRLLELAILSPTGVPIGQLAWDVRAGEFNVVNEGLLASELEGWV